MSTARCSTSAPANCRSTAICGRCAWSIAMAAGPRRPIAEVAIPALAPQFTPLDSRGIHPGLPME